MAEMTNAFDKIMAGLDDARAYLKGARDGFEVHEVEVPEPDVAAIRGKTGLSQPAFAKSIGVPLGSTPWLTRHSTGSTTTGRRDNQDSGGMINSGIHFVSAAILSKKAGPPHLANL